MHTCGNSHSYPPIAATATETVIHIKEAGGSLSTSPFKYTKEIARRILKGKNREFSKILLFFFWRKLNETST
jgi:hypothetical protein